jgi:hypothetical protein
LVLLDVWIKTVCYISVHVAGWSTMSDVSCLDYWP